MEIIIEEINFKEILVLEGVEVIITEDQISRIITIIEEILETKIIIGLLHHTIMVASPSIHSVDLVAIEEGVIIVDEVISGDVEILEEEVIIEVEVEEEISEVEDQTMIIEDVGNQITTIIIVGEEKIMISNTSKINTTFKINLNKTTFTIQIIRTNHPIISTDLIKTFHHIWMDPINIKTFTHNNSTNHLKPH